MAGGCTLETGETRDYRALLVANGHHWDPQWPSFEGMDVFEGAQLHSHHYLGDDPAFFAGKRVVVLGMGNSSMDIAVEASQTGTVSSWPPGAAPGSSPSTSSAARSTSS